jgi:putative membrane protein (TIGR04086 family)
MIRSIVAVVAAAVVAVALVAGIDALGHRVYPLPQGIDWNDPVVVGQIVRALPVGAFLFAVASWVVAAFVGSWLAARLAPSRPWLHGGIVGVVMLVATIANLMMFEHPLWVILSGLAGVPLCAWLGARAGGTPVAPPR